MVSIVWISNSKMYVCVAAQTAKLWIVATTMTTTVMYASEDATGVGPGFIALQNVKGLTGTITGLIAIPGEWLPSTAQARGGENNNITPCPYSAHPTHPYLDHTSPDHYR